MNDCREYVCKQEKSRGLKLFDHLSSCINIIFDHDDERTFVWLDQNFLTTLSDPADLSVSDAPFQEDPQFSL